MRPHLRMSSKRGGVALVSGSSHGLELCRCHLEAMLLVLMTIHRGIGLLIGNTRVYPEPRECRLRRWLAGILNRGRGLRGWLVRAGISMDMRSCQPDVLLGSELGL